jgi:hypothetical protein
MRVFHLLITGAVAFSAVAVLAAPAMAISRPPTLHDRHPAIEVRDQRLSLRDLNHAPRPATKQRTIYASRKELR